MRSKEAKVLAKSDYYTYQQSAVASLIYLYPTVIGYFFYEPGYTLHRNNYDSFLLMYIVSGRCDFHYEGRTFSARKNQFVFLDCYQPHEYCYPDASEILWIHFDGPLARSYYDLITASHGNVLTPDSPYSLVQAITKILELFRSSAPIRESVVSGYITQILTDLMSTSSEIKNDSSHAQIVEKSLAFINEHFSEPLSLESIAGYANLSPYYFTRLFTEKTGFTPHQYLIATRINAAKFLLQTPDMPVKEIAFASGFNSESSFCFTFKKWEKITPSEYRAKTVAP